MLKLELDNKEYHIPENADDLSLEKFDKIKFIISSKNNEEFTKGNVIDITSVMTGIDKEIFFDSPGNFFDFLVDKTKWVYSLNMEDYPIMDYIEIDGERFSYEKSEDITLREWVDIDTILSKFAEEDKNAAILAVRIRKVLKNKEGKYTSEIEKYDTKMIAERKDKFKQLPVSVIFPLLAFFLSKEKLSSNNTKLYSLMVGQALARQHQLSDWVKSSGGGKPLSNWRMKIYLKWMQFLTNELEKHVHFSHMLSQKTKRKAKQ